MKPENIQNILFVSNIENYGDKYIEHLLDQYKIYINATEKISDRRQKTNEFFLALNSALLALLGFITSKTNQVELNSILIASSISGITMCYLWYRIIYSYKALNDAKFRVVHAIEARLPLALYDTEWEMLGRGENKKLYWPFSHIELRVPFIFIFLYLFMIVMTFNTSDVISAYNILIDISEDVTEKFNNIFCDF